jgi:hypothetical protein
VAGEKALKKKQAVKTEQKTVQKGKRGIKQPAAEVKPEKSLVPDQKRLFKPPSGVGPRSDQQPGSTSILNECCKFCNNRLVMTAIRNNDLAKLKTLLADTQNITNPFQF